MPALPCPFERILCAIDFSPDSLRAFDVAAELARQESAVFHVLHVVEAEPAVAEWPPAAGEIGEAAVAIGAMASQAMDVFIASRKSALAGLSFSSEVTPGVAFAEILDRAREWHPDLIVLGSRGAVSLDRVVFGATAEQVMREARCSVLVVRKPSQRRP